MDQTYKFVKSYRFLAERYFEFYKFLENEVAPYVQQLYIDALKGYSYDPCETELDLINNETYVVMIVFKTYYGGERDSTTITIKLDVLDNENWKELLSEEKQRKQEEAKRIEEMNEKERLKQLEVKIKKDRLDRYHLMKKLIKEFETNPITDEESKKG